MMNSEKTPSDQESTLTTLVALYPHAFATVAASNSRAGLALRRFELTRAEGLHGSVDMSQPRAARKMSAPAGRNSDALPHGAQGGGVTPYGPAPAPDVA